MTAGRMAWRYGAWLFLAAVAVALVFVPHGRDAATLDIAQHAATAVAKYGPARP